MTRRELLAVFGVASVVACRGTAKPEERRTAEAVTLNVDGMI